MHAFVVWFRDLERWDAKHFLWSVRSVFPICSLARFIREHNEKVRLSENPGKVFSILGVTNTGGIFHAYDTEGKTLKQPYKRVDAGDFAYNPYRVNVGSIGIVPPELGGNYISPAYVVFRVDDSALDPEYLLLILKAPWFNPVLRAVTAGSVRQNLTFDLLGTLEIPVPPLSVQHAIVEQHRRVREEARRARERANRLEQEISRYVLKRLGVSTGEVQRIRSPFVIWFKDLERWSVEFNRRMLHADGDVPDVKYPIRLLGEFVECSRNGISVRPVLEPTPYKILKLNAIQESGFDPLQAKYVPISDRDASRFAVRKGELLICRSVGSFDLIAKACVVETDIPNLVYPDIIIRVRLKPGVDVHFVREVIQTPFGRQQFQARARTAVGMWKIGAEDIRAFELPLPPLPVQQEIVARVKELRAEIAAERQRANQIEEQARHEVEEMILGTRPVSAGPALGRIHSA